MALEAKAGRKTDSYLEVRNSFFETHEK